VFGADWTPAEVYLHSDGAESDPGSMEVVFPDGDNQGFEGSGTGNDPLDVGHGKTESDEDVTRYLMESGVLKVKDSDYPPLGKIKHHHEIFQILPEELRENLTNMLDPKKRKRMLTDIYKTKVFVASYWMLAIFAVLLFLPESKFFAPFIAGYVGGRKAGSVWKGMLAASMPFLLIGLLDILVAYNIIYHFYDLYLPSAGLLSNNINLMLVDYGMDPSGMEGSFYDPGTSLSKCAIYMVISAIIGGTLEGDARKLSRDTAEWVNVTNISNHFSK
jgi:hypothetical protein